MCTQDNLIVNALWVVDFMSCMEYFRCWRWLCGIWRW